MDTIPLQIKIKVRGEGLQNKSFSIIQSLRTFRRAGVIHAMVRRCNGVAVQWSAWRESSYQKGNKIMNVQLVLGNGHNEMIRWALIVPELAQVDAKLVPD